MSVSICIPAHNAASTIGDTLQSILDQSYRVEDIVVVDNASTDLTPEIVLGFADRDTRIRYIRFEEFVSAHDNFTRCFSLARGDLMAIFHADDIYRPTIVEEEVALLRRRPDIGGVFVKGDRIDRNGEALAEAFPIPSSIFTDQLAQFDFKSALKAVLQYGNIFLTPSAMVRTQIYRDEIKQWPYPDYGSSADLFVFLTIVKRHKIAILEKTLIDYRAAETSTSYMYARQRRSRHDLFMTLEHFVSGDAREFLLSCDYANYEFLVLKDDINIAISLIIDGDGSYARNLMPRLLRPSLVRAALGYQRHAKFLIFGYCVWLLSFFPLGITGRNALKKIRFG